MKPISFKNTLHLFAALAIISITAFSCNDKDKDGIHDTAKELRFKTSYKVEVVDDAGLKVYEGVDDAEGSGASMSSIVYNKELDKDGVVLTAYGLDDVKGHGIVVTAILKDDGTLYPIGKDEEGHFAHLILNVGSFSRATMPYGNSLTPNGHHAISNMKEYATNSGIRAITYRYEFSDVKIMNEANLKEATVRGYLECVTY